MEQVCPGVALVHLPLVAIVSPNVVANHTKVTEAYYVLIFFETLI